jgi:hypothetical protein
MLVTADGAMSLHGSDMASILGTSMHLDLFAPIIQSHEDRLAAIESHRSAMVAA